MKYKVEPCANPLAGPSHAVVTSDTEEAVALCFDQETAQKVRLLLEAVDCGFISMNSVKEAIKTREFSGRTRERLKSPCCNQNLVFPKSTDIVTCLCGKSYKLEMFANDKSVDFKVVPNDPVERKTTGPR